MLVDRPGLGVRTPPTVKTTRVLAAAYTRHLQRLGTTKRTAWNEVQKGRRSTWTLSGLVTINKAMRNVYFTVRGLVSLVDRWQSRAKTSVAPSQLTLALG